MTSSNGNLFRVTGLLCGEFPVAGEFPSQPPVTRSFDVFFDLGLNTRFSKQSRRLWFEMPLRPLWRHSNDHRHRRHRIAINMIFIIIIIIIIIFILSVWLIVVVAVTDIAFFSLNALPYAFCNRIRWCMGYARPCVANFTCVLLFDLIE